MRKRRFFYHYNRANKALTVHYLGKCNIVKDVECRVPCESKWNLNTQPNLVLRGWCKDVIIENNKAIII